MPGFFFARGQPNKAKRKLRNIASRQARDKEKGMNTKTSNCTVALNKMAKTTEFAKTCSPSCFDAIPAHFYRQADQQFNKFQIDGAMLRQRLVNIELFEPSLKTDPSSGQYVTAKLRLSGLLDPNLEFIAQSKSKDRRTDVKWLTGHYSPAIRFDQGLVQAGFITTEELQALIDYVDLWANLGDAAYEKGNTTKRLYLTSRNDDAVFQFDYVERTNPKTDEPTLGIENVGWCGMKLIGSTLSGEVQELQAAVQNIAHSQGALGTRQVTTTVAPTSAPAATFRPRPQ